MGALRTGIVKSIRNKNCWEKSVVKNSKPIGSLKENNSIQINVLQTWCSNRVWLCWHSSPCPLGLRLVTMGQEELHPHHLQGLWSVFGREWSHLERIVHHRRQGHPQADHHERPASWKIRG